MHLGHRSLEFQNAELVELVSGVILPVKGAGVNRAGTAGSFVVPPLSGPLSQFPPKGGTTSARTGKRAVSAANFSGEIPDKMLYRNGDFRIMGGTRYTTSIRREIRTSDFSSKEPDSPLDGCRLPGADGFLARSLRRCRRSPPAPLPGDPWRAGRLHLRRRPVHGFVRGRHGAKLTNDIGYEMSLASRPTANGWHLPASTTAARRST